MINYSYESYTELHITPFSFHSVPLETPSFLLLLPTKQSNETNLCMFQSLKHVAKF